MYSFNLPQKRELTFVHLYGDTIAVMEKAEYAGQMPRIIFPQGFLPEIGRKYVCHVRETKTGVFDYENQTYRVCRAWWEDGSPFDAIEWEFHGDGSKKKDGVAKLGDLFKGIEVALPEKHELLNLRVQSDRKNGGWQFVPKYSETDEDAGGKPSMRIFKPLGKKVTLELYRTYKVRQESVRNTGRPNAHGYIILEVDVTVL